MKKVLLNNGTDDIKLVRLRKGLLAAGGYLLYHVAEGLECSVGHASEIFNSRKLPTEKEALKIADLLGGGVDVLFPHTKEKLRNQHKAKGGARCYDRRRARRDKRETQKFKSNKQNTN